ncbi:hypothetical protein KSP39_PZI017137 [Platanthera zijinensis]|uniref:Uncharacterized protein n=1 Tax=Platanthera zijinensis TaxID=2320716 RepID=A0AAP0B5U1_9ASPA
MQPNPHSKQIGINMFSLIYVLVVLLYKMVGRMVNGDADFASLLRAVNEFSSMLHDSIDDSFMSYSYKLRIVGAEVAD